MCVHKGDDLVSFLDFLNVISLWYRLCELSFSVKLQYRRKTVGAVEIVLLDRNNGLLNKTS